VSAPKFGFVTIVLAVVSASMLAVAPPAIVHAGTPAPATASPGSPLAVSPASGATAAGGSSVIVSPASPVTTYAADRGVVSPNTATQPSSGNAAASLSKGARHLHTARGATPNVSALAPATQTTTPAAAAAVLHNFNGTSSLDSELTNYRLKFEPPDTAICQGNGFVLAPVNSAYRIFRPNGTTIEGPFNINDLFNEGGQEFTSDPRCHFDTRTGTWFATILFISADAQSSHLDIAVNPSGDPTTLWTEYRINTTHHGGAGCPCFGDQPRLGIDQYNFYVSTDEFSILGPQFNGAQLYVFAKPDLIARQTLHFAHFGNLHSGGHFALAVSPAISTGFPSAEYFLSSLDPNATFDNRIGVWAITGRQLLKGEVPVLSSTVITSEAYGFPVPATQKGSFSTLDAGDDRMQQVQFIGGNVWGELTTGLTISGDSTERDGGAWFSVHPTLSGDVLGSAVIKQQGYVAKSGAYLIYPALQADAAGRAAMVLTLSGDKNFPSAAYAVLGSGQTQFGAPVVAAPGSGPYDPNAGRWGDYSWAVLDPATDTFWLAAEYMPPVSSQTSTGERNWGTRVFDVSVS
jgi:hypothetical protein